MDEISKVQWICRGVSLVFLVAYLLIGGKRDVWMIWTACGFIATSAVLGIAKLTNRK